MIGRNLVQRSAVRAAISGKSVTSQASEDVSREEGKMCSKE